MTGELSLELSALFFIFYFFVSRSKNSAWNTNLWCQFSRYIYSLRGGVVGVNRIRALRLRVHGNSNSDCSLFDYKTHVA